jgi:hypothetical protein
LNYARNHAEGVTYPVWLWEAIPADMMIYIDT